MTTLVGDSLSAPPPGSTAVGDLYVDLQTRTMWMGVDAAVDPSEAVLLSDILSIQPAINDALVLAKGYVDTKLNGYSLVGHKHVAADITDFDAAVDASIANNPSGGGFSRGMVIMYSGPMADIGVGPLAGWTLCDGSNGAPNLIDQFVMGAGNRPTGSTNTGKAIRTDVVPAHTHTVGYHMLTMDEMPYHNHGVSASGGGSGGTDAQGSHQHYFGASYIGSGIGSNGGYVSASNNNGALTGFAGNHSHNVSVSVSVSGATDYRGSNYGHNHDLDIQGAHDHGITASDLRDGLPYFVIAFIMKL